MKITKRQLRRIIREAIEESRGAYGIDVRSWMKSKPVIEDWVRGLFDDLKETVPQFGNIDPKFYDRAVEKVSSSVEAPLLDVLRTFAPREIRTEQRLKKNIREAILSEIEPRKSAPEPERNIIIDTQEPEHREGRVPARDRNRVLAT